MHKMFIIQLFNVVFKLIWDQPWYKEGFESNEVVKAVEDEAFQLGKSGKDLVIPEKYNNAQELFIYYDKQGKEEYINPLPFFLTGTAVMASGVVGGCMFMGKRKKTTIQIFTILIVV